MPLSTGWAQSSLTCCLTIQEGQCLFVSCTLTTREWNYSQLEKEGLSMMLAYKSSINHNRSQTTDNHPRAYKRHTPITSSCMLTKVGNGTCSLWLWHSPQLTTDRSNVDCRLRLPRKLPIDAASTFKYTPQTACGCIYRIRMYLAALLGTSRQYIYRFATCVKCWPWSMRFRRSIYCRCTYHGNGIYVWYVTIGWSNGI